MEEINKEQGNEEKQEEIKETSEPIKAEDGAVNQDGNVDEKIEAVAEKSENVSDSLKSGLEKGFDSILGVDDGSSTQNIDTDTDESKGADVGGEDRKDSTDLNKSAMSSNKLKNIIIGVLVVIVIVLAWLWQGSYQNNRSRNTTNDAGAKERVVVSDKKEQGIVRIVEKGDSNFGISNTTLLADNQVGITAYFGNTQENKEMTDCSIVFPLDRIIEKKYDSDMVNAVKGLLQPLSSEESARGYISTLPKSTTLKYIKVNNGVAEVNFSADLNRVGGSCAVTAIRAQIEKTLLQFPEIKSVVICVDGNCMQDMILQP